MTTRTFCGGWLRWDHQNIRSILPYHGKLIIDLDNIFRQNLLGTLDTFTIGDPDIGPHLFETFWPSTIGPI